MSEKFRGQGASVYGIQSGGGKFVEKIEGDYDTVVGLSLKLVKELLKEAEALD